MRLERRLARLLPTATATALKRRAQQIDRIGVIFATGASQLETLRALVKLTSLPWTALTVFIWMNTSGFPLIILRLFGATCGTNSRNVSQSIAFLKSMELRVIR